MHVETEASTETSIVFDETEQALLDTAWGLLAHRMKTERWSGNIRDSACNLIVSLIRNKDQDPDHGIAAIEAAEANVNRLQRRQGTARIRSAVSSNVRLAVIIASNSNPKLFSDRDFPFKHEDCYAAAILAVANPRLNQTRA